MTTSANDHQRRAVGLRGSYAGKPIAVNDDLFLLNDAGLNTESKFFELVNQLVAVNKINRRCTVACGFFTASLVKAPVVISSPLSARPTIAPRKSRTVLAVTAPAIVCTERSHGNSTTHLSA